MGITEDAPDFGPVAGYPSRGERIGPAWRRVWRELADGEWHLGADLAEACAIEVLPQTIKTLLWQADRNGLVAKELRSAPGRTVRRSVRAAWYRRADLAG